MCKQNPNFFIQSAMWLQENSCNQSSSGGGHTLMETETMTEASKGAESGLNQLAVVGVKFIDDTDKDMTSEVLDDLQLDCRGAKDLLHKDDVYKYKGDEKFNPKSFKSGSSLGYVDLRRNYLLK